MKKSEHDEEWFEFSTDSMDILGQGVSKSGGMVSFVSKSLPGESGRAKVFFQKKNWRRGVLVSTNNLSIKSPLRKNPDCRHFENCFGCHYLHTDYHNELHFKKNALLNHLRKIDLPEIKIIGAKKRDGHRNRMQLHYDLKNKKIGMMGPFGIVETPDCQLPTPLLHQAIKKFTENDWWIHPQFKDHPEMGHIEFCLTEKNDISMALNQKYAHLGFSQVNTEMNQQLVNLITEQISQEHREGLILDLFGGNGNLTSKITSPILVCDGEASTCTNFQQSLQINLYSKNALQIINQQIKLKKISGIIFDPPRSGLKEISLWVKQLLKEKKSWFIYVSCSPDTLARDLENLKNNEPKFKCKNIFLVDLFPGTYHFETLAVFRKEE